MATTNITNSAASAINSLGEKIDQHMAEARAGVARMDRMETKIDQLADAVVSIARAEEKIAILMQDTKEIKESFVSSTLQLHKLEMKTEANSADLKTLGKFFWIVVGAAASVAVSAIAMSMGIIH
jgi:chromosome segregation ATPase